MGRRGGLASSHGRRWLRGWLAVKLATCHGVVLLESGLVGVAVLVVWVVGTASRWVLVVAHVAESRVVLVLLLLGWHVLLLLSRRTWCRSSLLGLICGGAGVRRGRSVRVKVATLSVLAVLTSGLAVLLRLAAVAAECLRVVLLGLLSELRLGLGLLLLWLVGLAIVSLLTVCVILRRLLLLVLLLRLGLLLLLLGVRVVCLLLQCVGGRVSGSVLLLLLGWLLLLPLLLLAVVAGGRCGGGGGLLG